MLEFEMTFHPCSQQDVHARMYLAASDLLPTLISPKRSTIRIPVKAVAHPHDLRSPMATRKQLTWLALLVASASGYTWPNPKLDELEALLYDQFGFNAPGILTAVLPCNSFVDFNGIANRSNAADWIRTVRLPSVYSSGLLMFIASYSGLP